jgi:hypothetical protein
MPMSIIDAGSTDRAITALRIIDAGGTDRVIAELRMIDTTGTDRIIYTTASPLSVTADNGIVTGTTGSGTSTTNSATVTAANGTPPYTYAWTVASYDHPSVSPTANSPTGATSTFTQTSIGVGEYYSADFLMTVTDDVLATATVTVQAVWSDIS